MKKILLCLLLVIMTMLSACNRDDVVRKSYITLVAVEEAYVGIHKAKTDAYNSGLITKDQSDKIDDLLKITYVSFMTAKKSLKTYAESDADSTSSTILLSLVSSAALNANNLITLYNSICDGVDGVEPWGQMIESKELQLENNNE